MKRFTIKNVGTTKKPIYNLHDKHYGYIDYDISDHIAKEVNGMEDEEIIEYYSASDIISPVVKYGVSYPDITPSDFPNDTWVGYDG